MTKKQKFFWLLFTLFIGAVVFIYSFNDVDFREFSGLFKQTNYFWLILALLLIIFYYFSMSWTLDILLGKDNKASAWGLIRIPFMEQFGNGITPFSFGGQPLQILGLNQAGIPVGQASSISLMKFVIYQGMIVVAFLICLIFGYQYVADHMLSMTGLVIFGLVIHILVLLALISIMFFPPVTKKIADLCLKPFSFFLSDDQITSIRKKLDDKIVEFHDVSEQLLSNPKKILAASLVTLLQLFLFYSIPYFILLAVHADNADFMFIIALNVILTLAISIFPVPGGSGGAEAGFALLFSSFLSNHTVTIFAMLLWRIITYYFGIFAGLIAYNVLPNNRHGKNNDKK
ncbi:YbhN family protein [Oenococcus alcoholitolerans]|uniref:lysylphosphatidylglycerol synthase transmembrane domain-containing protein n=1 Tax=Oenococcus alcoholitolerans TaxID=931074 RepID=UPI003F6F2040